MKITMYEETITIRYDLKVRKYQYIIYNIIIEIKYTKFTHTLDIKYHNI